jgi:hypothetical protein
MREKRKIGWQKYESVIEEQMSSPLLQDILSQKEEQHEEEEEYERLIQEFNNNDEDVKFVESSPAITISEQMMNELSMLTSFDCWVGHTNFNITPSMKAKLDSVEGVELLKICSRYRFFIGIGKMFDFKTVRTKLEKELL